MNPYSAANKLLHFHLPSSGKRLTYTLLHRHNAQHSLFKSSYTQPLFSTTTPQILLIQKRGYAAKAKTNNPKTPPHLNRMLLHAAKWEAEEKKKQPPVERPPSQYKDVYRIVGAAILDRLPTIHKLPEDWEQEYWDFRLERDTENSRRPWFYSEIRLWGLRGAPSPKEEEKSGAKGKKKGKDDKEKSGSAEADQSLLSSVEAELQEKERKKAEEAEEDIAFISQFVPAPRETADDLANNRKSLNRALDTHLYLIVKKKRSSGDTGYEWQFPQGGNEKEETIKDTAERELKEECGITTAHFLGNAPVGHIEYLLPKSAQEMYKAESAKVFFHRAIYQSGPIKLNEKEGLVDYLWVSKKELQEYVHPDYYKSVADLLDD